MEIIEIDRIVHHFAPDAHAPGLPREKLCEVTIDAGRRAELQVPPGRRACLRVLEGAVRIEGDDTTAVEGDLVWFKPVHADGEAALLGMEADTPFRGVVLAADASRAAAG